MMTAFNSWLRKILEYLTTRFHRRICRTPRTRPVPKPLSLSRPTMTITSLSPLLRYVPKRQTLLCLYPV